MSAARGSLPEASPTASDAAADGAARLDLPQADTSISAANRSGRLRRYGIWAALLLVAAVFAAVSPSFRSVTNLTNILEQNAMLGIVACGMLAMMLTGGFDLSVGAIGATASVVAAYFSAHDGVTVAIIAGLGVGVVIGFVNGVLIAKVAINAFMTTFAMASVVTGVLFVVTNASPVTANAGWLTSLALNKVAGIPEALILYVVVVIITWLLMTLTKWGHYVYAIGGNKEASYLSGLPVVSTHTMAYVFGGFCAGLAGLILLGQSDIGQPSSATDWPLTAIAICVIAGVSLQGGEGRVVDTVAATLLLGVVADGLNLINVSPYIQPTVTGVIILAAVTMDKYSRSHSSG